MGIFDGLTGLMQPTVTPGAPPLVPLQAPPPVKPTVVQIKPRINPPGVNPMRAAGNVDPGTDLASNKPLGGGTTFPKLGPAADTAPPAGAKKLFDNSDVIGDAARGFLDTPAGAGAISAFAYGFAGAVSAQRARLAAEKTAAAAADDKEFDRGLKTNADKRAERETRIKELDANADDEAKAAGLLTTAQIRLVDQMVENRRKVLLPSNGFLSDEDKAKAIAELDAYRDWATEFVRTRGRLPKADEGPKTKGKGDRLDGPGGEGPPAGATGVEVPKGAYAGTDKGVPQRAPGAAPTAAAIGGVQGDGTASKPFRGFTNDPQSVKAFEETVPIGGYYVTVDASGKETIRRRER